MKLNLESIKTRLERLNLYIEELEKRQKLSLSDYKNSTSEQMVVALCANIASHVVSVYELGRPIEQRDVFGKLSEAGYIDKDYGLKMGQLVGLRNRIVHMYWALMLSACTNTFKKTSAF